MGDKPMSDEGLIVFSVFVGPSSGASRVTLFFWNQMDEEPIYDQAKKDSSIEYDVIVRRNETR